MVSCVSFLIVADFPTPVFPVGLGPLEEPAIMAMPETTVYEYYGLVLGQDQVWGAWQLAIMEAVAKTQCE